MRRFLPYLSLLRPVRLHFLGAFVCGILFGVSSGFGLPFAILMIFPLVFGPVPPDGSVLFLAVAFLPGIFLLRGLSGYFNTYLVQYCGFRVLEDLRLQVFSKIQRLQLQYLERSSRGDILSRTMSDTMELKNSVTGISNDLMMQPFVFLSAVGALVYISLKQDELIFVLFSLAVIPVCALPIRYIGRKLFLRANQMQAQLGTMTDFVNQNLGAARDVRLFNLEEEQTRRFGVLVGNFFRIQLKLVKYTRSLAPIIEILASVGVAAAIYYAAGSGIGLEDVVALITALYMSYEPIKRLGGVHNLLKRGLASLDRLEAVLNEPESITDRPNACELSSVRGDFEFSGVSFDYGDGPILEGLDMVLPAGRVYAIVGPSGAGKSTVIHLILRLYDVVAGRILLDGQDLRDIRVQSLRRNIALVPQDPGLFNDTIFNNIRLSRPGSDLRAVRAAAQRAHADSFVMALENGYDTVVGEMGARLSGGQRQRIAIARAFLKNAPVLILDEATSALDSVSEEKIQLALRELMHGKTVLIIAHRFSTIQLADEILMFARGRLIGRGTDKELQAHCPPYRALYGKQIL